MALGAGFGAGGGGSLTVITTAGGCGGGGVAVARSGSSARVIVTSSSFAAMVRAEECFVYQAPAPIAAHATAATPRNHSAFERGGGGA
jgi:hypothetical protein